MNNVSVLVIASVLVLCLLAVFVSLYRAQRDNRELITTALALVAPDDNQFHFVAITTHHNHTVKGWIKKDMLSMKVYLDGKELTLPTTNSPAPTQ